jgi:hypothetical protein
MAWYPLESITSMNTKNSLLVAGSFSVSLEIFNLHGLDVLRQIKLKDFRVKV